MTESNTSQKLLDATIHLLKTKPTITKLTAREIVAEAQVNLAMIAYCYGSKDQLINTAVKKIISEDFQELSTHINTKNSPQTRLAELLYAICETVFKYEKISRLSIPYLLLESEIQVPLFILPLVTSCFNGTKTETEYKIAAYELISFLQLIFYQKEHFKQYTGIDLQESASRKKIINDQVQLFFGNPH